MGERRRTALPAEASELSGGGGIHPRCPFFLRYLRWENKQMRTVTINTETNQYPGQLARALGGKAPKHLH